MIRLKASAVLAVRDGFSQKAISASSVQCFVDGQRFHPQFRQGGYLVFINLSEGEHEILLRGAYYQEERITIVTGRKGWVERGVTLKPSADYPFRQRVTRLIVSQAGISSAAGGLLWVAAGNRLTELRLAQDEVKKGEQSLRLYFYGSPEGRFPGNYLLLDGKKSEVVSLADLDGAQTGRLESPLLYPHKRGVLFLPAQPYPADREGKVRVYFREPGEVHLFEPERKTVTRIALQPGNNEVELSERLQGKE